MWEFHRAQRARMTVGVSLHQVDIPYGEFTLQGTRISRVEEKPRKEFPINAGIYLLDPSLIDADPARAVLRRHRSDPRAASSATTRCPRT